MSAPLTDLLKKNGKFVWNETCQNSLENIKTMLSKAPVLLAPNFVNHLNLLLMLMMLVQGRLLQDENGVDQPVCYFSHKFNKHQKVYSTIEKEYLVLIFSGPTWLSGKVFDS